MIPMLHVVNGDATLALLKQSAVAGTFLVWRDMLMEGPVEVVLEDGSVVITKLR